VAAFIPERNFVLTSVIRRLPTDLQHRWLRDVASVDETNREANFKDVVLFLKKEAQVLNTAFGRHFHPQKKSSRFTTNAMVVTNAQSGICSLCSASHDLRNRYLFKQKSLTDRMLHMRLHKLCYNCFRRGHVARRCYGKGACTVRDCKLKHHTLLHRDLPATRNPPGEPTEAQRKCHGNEDSSGDRPNANLVCAGGRIGSSAYLNIVQVRVFSGGKEVQTYAFLDQGSTTTLCDRRLLDKLGMSGEEVEFSLSMINKQLVNRHGRKVQLRVAPLDGSDVIELPHVFSVGHLPVSQTRSLCCKTYSVGLICVVLNLRRFRAQKYYC